MVSTVSMPRGRCASQRRGAFWSRFLVLAHAPLLRKAVRDGSRDQESNAEGKKDDSGNNYVWFLPYQRQKAYSKGRQHRAEGHNGQDPLSWTLPVLPKFVEQKLASFSSQEFGQLTARIELVQEFLLNFCAGLNPSLPPTMIQPGSWLLPPHGGKSRLISAPL